MVVKSRAAMNATDKDFIHVFVHEMAHVFWEQYYRTTKPHWINEGLASAIGKEHWTEFTREELKKQIIDKKIDKLLAKHMKVKKFEIEFAKLFGNIVK